MNPRALILTVAIAALPAVPAQARMSLPSKAEVEAATSPALPPYLECVPYARAVSGIQIYGDAHTWWNKAEGRYARGFKPQVGAVLAFKPNGNSTLGHVAAVSRIIDKRTILIRHANWSPINGRRGQIEDNVRVIDVSDDNDWSAVRVWYAPLQSLGVSHWPVQGFIYPDKPQRPERLGRDKAAQSAPSLASKTSPDPIGSIIQRKLGW